MIVTLFSIAVWSSTRELPSTSTRTFPEALCLNKCSVNHLKNKFELMHDDFRFMYTSDPGDKPSPKSGFLLTSLNITTRGRNLNGGMGVCLLWVLCVVRQRSLRRADHSTRGDLPNVVRRWVWSRNLVNEEALDHWGLVRQIKKKYALLRWHVRPVWLYNICLIIS